MAQRYEVLMLSVPEITKDEASSLEKSFETIVKEAKGEILSFERWGKYKLTYPIRKNEYGVYFLARFENMGSVTLLNNVKSFFAIKVNELVMRHVVVRLEDGADLAYQRPRSLEEAPTSRDVDTFLKANKMEGLMSSGSTGHSSRDGARVSIPDSLDDAIALDLVDDVSTLSDQESN